MKYAFYVEDKVRIIFTIVYTAYQLEQKSNGTFYMQLMNLTRFMVSDHVTNIFIFQGYHID